MIIAQLAEVSCECEHFLFFYIFSEQRYSTLFMPHCIIYLWKYQKVKPKWLILLTIAQPFVALILLWSILIYYVRTNSSSHYTFISKITSTHLLIERLRVREGNSIQFRRSWLITIALMFGNTLPEHYRPFADSNYCSLPTRELNESNNK